MAMIFVQNLVKERKYPFILALVIFLVSATIRENKKNETLNGRRVE
jgi:hypothetical protein